MSSVSSFESKWLYPLLLGLLRRASSGSAKMWAQRTLMMYRHAAPLIKRITLLLVVDMLVAFVLLSRNNEDSDDTFIFLSNSCAAVAVVATLQALSRLILHRVSLILALQLVTDASERQQLLLPAVPVSAPVAPTPQASDRMPTLARARQVVGDISKTPLQRSARARRGSGNAPLTAARTDALFGLEPVAFDAPGSALLNASAIASSQPAAHPLDLNAFVYGPVTGPAGASRASSWLDAYDSQLTQSKVEVGRQEPGAMQYRPAERSAVHAVSLPLAEWVKAHKLPLDHPIAAVQSTTALEQLANTVRKAIAVHFTQEYLPRLKKNTDTIIKLGGRDVNSGQAAFTEAFLERRERGARSTGTARSASMLSGSGLWGVASGHGAARSSFPTLKGGLNRTTVSAAASEAFAMHKADLAAKRAFDERRTKAAAAPAPQPAAPAWGANMFGGQQQAAEAEPVPRIEGALLKAWHEKTTLDAYLAVGPAIESSGDFSSSSSQHAGAGIVGSFDVQGYVLARLEDLVGCHLPDARVSADPAMSSYLGDEVALNDASVDSRLVPTDAQILLHYFGTMLDEQATVELRGSVWLQGQGGNAAGSEDLKAMDRIVSSEFIRLEGATTGASSSAVANGVAFLNGGQQVGASSTGIPRAGSARGGEEDASRRFAILVSQGPDMSAMSATKRKFLLSVDGQTIDLSRSLNARDHAPAVIGLFCKLQVNDKTSSGTIGSRSVSSGEHALCLQRGVYSFKAWDILRSFVPGPGRSFGPATAFGPSRGSPATGTGQARHVLPASGHSFGFGVGGGMYGHSWTNDAS